MVEYTLSEFFRPPVLNSNSKIIKLLPDLKDKLLASLSYISLGIFGFICLLLGTVKSRFGKFHGPFSCAEYLPVSILHHAYYHSGIFRYPIGHVCAFVNHHDCGFLGAQSL